MVKRTVFVLILFFLFFTFSSVIWAEENIGECLACHQKETRGIFLAWVNSKHAQNGVDCTTCHKNHETAKPKKSAVGPEVCAQCHPERYDQFEKGRQYERHSPNRTTSSQADSSGAAIRLPGSQHLRNRGRLCARSRNARREQGWPGDHAGRQAAATANGVGTNRCDVEEGISGRSTSLVVEGIDSFLATPSLNLVKTRCESRCSEVQVEVPCG
jgi:predicted CXXCH cytochrome family protein